jgi:hypothetical protein
MNRIKLRVGLRRLLLIVALFAVCFAWLGARRERQRQNIRAELDNWQHSRNFALSAPIVPGMEESRRGWLAEIDAEIAKRKELLGE